MASADRPARVRRTRAWVRLRTWLVPVVVLLCVTLPHLEQGGFRTDTGWYSAIGMQAWRTGELLTLYREPGVAYFNKPPLAILIHGGVLEAWRSLTGEVSLAVARLPSVFAACICVIATVGTARVFTTRWASMTCGVVLALSYEFFRRVREISLDMWQVAFVMLAVWAIASAVQRGRRGGFVLGGVAVGLALLCKPLAAFIALAFLGGWMLWIGQWRRVAWLGVGGVVAAIVAGSWHGAMILEHGDAFTGQYFGAEIIERASATGDGLKKRAVEPWWYYLDEMSRTYWPWAVFLALSVITFARGVAMSSERRLEKLALIWAIGWFVVISLFTEKRPRYALPVYPGFALLAGLWLANQPWAWLRRLTRIATPWFVGGLVVVSVVLAALPIRFQSPEHPQWPAVFAWCEENAVGADDLWQADISGDRAARFYLEFGWWPTPTHDRYGNLLREPPAGAYVLYHREDGMLPGEGETIVFDSGHDVLVSRRGEGAWAPIRGQR